VLGGASHVAGRGQSKKLTDIVGVLLALGDEHDSEQRGEQLGQPVERPSLDRDVLGVPVPAAALARVRFPLTEAWRAGDGANDLQY
jgi:hypothetical protein